MIYYQLDQNSNSDSPNNHNLVSKKNFTPNLKKLPIDYHSLVVYLLLHIVLLNYVFFSCVYTCNLSTVSMNEWFHQKVTVVYFFLQLNDKRKTDSKREWIHQKVTLVYFLFTTYEKRKTDSKSI